MKGTFTIAQLKTAMDEIQEVPSIKMVYFEGGEPFLYYPLMLEGIRIARSGGLDAGVVTNAYWATSEEDAKLWLESLLQLGVSNISVSDDAFHYGSVKNNKARNAIAALELLEGPVCVLNTESGDVMLKGRAVEKLAEDYPKRHWKELIECPHEDLENPNRVHLDAFGNIHLCQGLCMGNAWNAPLSEIIKNYDPDSNPIVKSLLKGGPAGLAMEYKVNHEEFYASECHLCYEVRKSLIDKFPEYLAPEQVYGL